MTTVFSFIVALQILAALAMIGLVLIQHGKGADMGASFGSGASGSLFGATGSANFLSRSTAGCAAVFFVATLWLAYSANDRPRSTGGSILDRPAVGASAPAAMVAPTASGAGAIPGAIPAAVTGSVPGAAGSAPPIVVAPTAPPSALAPMPTPSGAGAIPQK